VAAQFSEVRANGKFYWPEILTQCCQAVDNKFTAPCKPTATLGATSISPSRIYLFHRANGLRAAPTRFNLGKTFQIKFVKPDSRKIVGGLGEFAAQSNPTAIIHIQSSESSGLSQGSSSPVRLGPTLG